MEYRLTRQIEAPVDEVFAIASDLRNAAETIRGIEKMDILTDGPIGVGTRWRETRIMFGKEATEEMWITGFEPNTSYTVESDSCGAHVVTVISFSQEGSTTTIEMVMDWKAQSLFAKVMMGVMGLIFGRSMKKLLLADLDDIKSAAEGTGGTPVAVPG